MSKKLNVNCFFVEPLYAEAFRHLVASWGDLSIYEEAQAHEPHEPPTVEILHEETSEQPIGCFQKGTVGFDLWFSSIHTAFWSRTRATPAEEPVLGLAQVSCVQVPPGPNRATNSASPPPLLLGGIMVVWEPNETAMLGGVAKCPASTRLPLHVVNRLLMTTVCPRSVVDLATWPAKSRRLKAGRGLPIHLIT